MKFGWKRGVKWKNQKKNDNPRHCFCYKCARFEQHTDICRWNKSRLEQCTCHKCSYKWWKTLERYGDPGTETEVVLDEAHFPDANFRKYLSDELNITEGDIITETDLNSVTEIYLNKSNVSSLKGIEYFKKLTDLYYYKNSLSSLDISMNTDLTTGS